jgi:hypothetical protein
VSRSRFLDFWSLVPSCLAPGGRVFLIDNRNEVTGAQRHQTQSDLELRRLHHGRHLICGRGADPPARPALNRRPSRTRRLAR